MNNIRPHHVIRKQTKKKREIKAEKKWIYEWEGEREGERECRWEGQGVEERERESGLILTNAHVLPNNSYTVGGGSDEKMRIIWWRNRERTEAAELVCSGGGNGRKRKLAHQNIKQFEHFWRKKKVLAYNLAIKIFFFNTVGLSSKCS